MAGPATGKRAGGAIADILTRTLRDHKEATAALDVAIGARSRAAFLEGLEQHLTPFLAEMWGKVAKDEDVPAEVRAMAAEIAGPAHQFTALLQFAAAALSIFQLAGAISTPLAEKLLQDRNQETPHGLISPQEAALGLVKGVSGGPNAYTEALKGGYDAAHLDYLVAITGDPPPIQELLLLWRRGQLDTERLNHGIRQSRTKNEWIDAIHDLRYVPPGPGVAVEAVLKGHMSPADGARLYGESGIDPRFFAVHVAASGRPVGLGEALELYRREEIDRGRLEAIVRQSDINNAFMPEVEKLAVTRPPPRSVPALLKAGAITTAQAFRLLKDHGYPDELARAVIEAATKEKAQGHHDIAESQIVRGYRDRFIDHAKATAMLTALGWDAGEAAYLLGLADAEREYQQTQRGINAIRSRYVNWHVPRSVASSALDAMGVPHDARDDLIRVWDIEHEATRAELTPAQIAGLWTRDLVTDADAVARLEAQGYRTTDAHLLLLLYATPAPAPQGRPKTLTLAQTLKAHREGDITTAEAHNRIVALGYNEDDTAILLAENPGPQGGA